MEIPLTDYFVNLRSVLSDPGTAGAYAWADEQLLGALISTIQMGMGPKGMRVSSDGTKTVTDLDVENYDARGYLVFQAALGIMGGRTLFSWKQRSHSVTHRPEERAMTLDHLRRQIKRLESSGDPHGTGRSPCFGIWQNFENALCPRNETERIA